jgi:two-component system sensor histidine kinase/response regulator
MATSGLRQRLPPKRILVAEDEPSVANTLRMVLAVDGHSVNIAEDGKQALAMFEGGTYDLVITDFKMANMDGLELAEAIKKRSPSTPIILVTAYAEAIQGTGGNVTNVDIVLSKPWSVTQLQDALQKVFPSA